MHDFKARIIELEKKRDMLISEKDSFSKSWENYYDNQIEHVTDLINLNTEWMKYFEIQCPEDYSIWN